MSLHDVRDEFLARHASRGDGAAFAELARRYQPLLAAAVGHERADGLDSEDARQAALIGLWEACRETDGVRSFAGLARLRVRWRVAATRRAALARKQRILSHAARDGDGPDGALTWAATCSAADPARVLELREELRERWHEREQRARRRARAPGADLRRRYSDQQVTRALTMIIDGATVATAADAVGARYGAVHAWLDRPREDARQARRVLAARRFTDEHVARAVSMVAHGSTITAAATAVGASHPTILRWLGRAA